MAKKKTRQRTGVTIDLPARPLAHSDAIFVIRRKGQKIGELRVSQGGVDWYSRYKQRPLKFGWRQFADALEAAKDR